MASMEIKVKHVNGLDHLDDTGIFYDEIANEIIYCTDKIYDDDGIPILCCISNKFYGDDERVERHLCMGVSVEPEGLIKLEEIDEGEIDKTTESDNIE